MKITGHRTREVFDLNNIVNIQDLAEAGRKVVTLHQERMVIPRRGYSVDTSRKGKYNLPRAGVAQLLEQRFCKPRLPYPHIPQNPFSNQRNVLSLLVIREDLIHPISLYPIKNGRVCPFPTVPWTFGGH